MKRLFAFIMTVMMLLGNCCFTMAEDYGQLVKYPDDVSYEMCKYSFWTNLRQNPNEVLLSKEEIQRINERIVQEGLINHVVNIENVNYIEGGGLERFDRELYIDGWFVNEEELVREMENSIEVLPNYLYAVTVKRANLRAWPMKDFLGFTPSDPIDELQNSILEINSPVVISRRSYFHNHLYYNYRLSMHLTILPYLHKLLILLNQSNL